MLRRISTLPLMAYIAISAFVNDFKKDERGLSGVVVTVLLILVAVLAVLVIWGALSGWLEELWVRIRGEASNIS